MADTETATIQYKDFPPEYLEAYELGDMVAEYMAGVCPDWDEQDVIEVLIDGEPYWVARRIERVDIVYQYDTVQQNDSWRPKKFFSWEWDVPKK